MIKKIISHSYLNNLALVILLFSILVVAITWVLYTRVPITSDPLNPSGFTIGFDWQVTFRPSVLMMFAGKNPYDIPIYRILNPPWVLLALAPLALLPLQMGTAVLFVLGLFIFGYAAIRFKASPWIVAAFVLSPQVIGNSVHGNVDWMVALGATLPPQIGLFFVLTKPQMGACIALFWLVEIWRSKGLRQVVRVFAPVTIALLLSFALYGFWPLKIVSMVQVNSTNVSLFPQSLPIGIALLARALSWRKQSPAVMASPFLSPYMQWNSWSIALFGLVNSPYLFWATWATLWVLRLVWRI
ncbi:MAG: hypothetical protein P4L50_23880 [Anaerolineaceae bacterium]|nr:hypothetical protein [Anaerolineaceae bacterium]